MYTVNVTDVIDGNTFEADRVWSFAGYTGRKVRIRGYNPPALHEPEGQLARTRLLLLVQGSSVHVGRITAAYEDYIVCDVYHDGVHIKEHFKKYSFDNIAPSLYHHAADDSMPSQDGEPLEALPTGLTGPGGDGTGQQQAAAL